MIVARTDTHVFSLSAEGTELRIYVRGNNSTIMIGLDMAAYPHLAAAWAAARVCDLSRGELVREALAHLVDTLSDTMPCMFDGAIA
jgi:hypothetical protein